MAERTAPAVGIRLKSIREAKGISLREIAHTTKLSTRTLEAVERGEFRKLPGGIYRRSVIRSYAAAIDLNPDEILDAFLAECPGQIEPVSRLDPADAESAAAPTTLSARLLQALARLRRAAVPLVFVLPALWAALVWTMRADAVLPSSPVEALSAYAFEAAPAAPAVLPVALLLQDEAARASSMLTVELLAVAPCWVALGMDGGALESRLLAAGERTLIEAEREVALTVGDAGAVALRINGRPAQPLGAAGAVVTTRISAENLPEFLGS